MPPVFLWLLFALVGAMVSRRRGRRSRFRQNLLEAKALLDGGSPGDAAVRFAALAEAMRWDSDLRGWARFYEGFSQLLAGQLDLAVDRLSEVARRPAGSSGWEQVRTSAAGNLASALALRGDVLAAEPWLEFAERRTPTVGFWCTPRAILDCRRGRFDEVARTLDAQWTQLEATHTAHWMRFVRCLRAFAEAQRTSARDDSAVERWLAALRPHRPGELAWLGARWPELKTFLSLRGLD